MQGILPRELRRVCVRTLLLLVVWLGDLVLN